MSFNSYITRAVRSLQVHPGAVLCAPTGGGEERVNLLAGEGFGGGHDYDHMKIIFLPAIEDR